MLSKLFLRISFLLAAVTLMGVHPFVIPVSGDNSQEVSFSVDNGLTDTLESFSQSLVNGNSQQIVGVYAGNSFAYQIVQQPSGNPGYISTDDDIVTQFSQAALFNSIGLIAHNTLAGADFSALAVGDQISIVYGDGSIKSYLVTDIRQFQALSPRSPYSNFVDLEDPSDTLDVVSVFKEVYATANRLVLQTCIAKDNEDSWGRLFIIAEPLDLTPVYD